MQWFGFKSVQIWDLGPGLQATRGFHLTASLDIGSLGFPVDYLSSACLCVFMKIKGEKIQDSVSEKKVWTVHEYRTLLDMPSSTLCSLSLSPPAAPGHWPFTFLAILNFCHFPECPFTLFLVGCDKYCSLCLANFSLPYSPHSLSLAQSQATYHLNTWRISTYSLAFLVLPLGVFLWWHQSDLDYTLPWSPLVPLSGH